MKRTLSILLAAFILAVGASAPAMAAVDAGAKGAQDEYFPLTITDGFNEDVVAEAYPAQQSTSIAFDAEDSTSTNFVWYSEAYVAAFKAASGSTKNITGALPDGGLLQTNNAALSSGAKFQLGAYDKNNTLRLSQKNPSGTLTLKEQQSYSKISVLGASGSGIGTIRVTLNYADGSTQSQEFVCEEWYNFRNYVISGLGRVSRVKKGTWPSEAEGEPQNAERNGPYLYEFKLDADETKKIQSIGFEQLTRTQDSSTASNLMAVSGVVPAEEKAEEGKAGRWDKSGGKWYYTDANGKLFTGWIEMPEGTWYYLDPKDKGAMATGYYEIKGKWYEFKKSGVYVKQIANTGWKQFSKGWSFKANGKWAYGWKQISGKWYHFDSKGYMEKGWLKSGGKWYYLQPSGAMTTGWKKLDWKSTSLWYYFHDNGVMATNWTKVDGQWYYLKHTGHVYGSMVKGWHQDGNKWYYLKKDGSMATGSCTIDGKTHNFASSGLWQGQAK